MQERAEQPGLVARTSRRQECVSNTEWMQKRGGRKYKQIQENDCQAECKSQVCTKEDNGLKVSLSCYREDGRYGRGKNRKKFLGLWSRNDHQRGKGGQSMRWVRGGVSIPSPQPWTVPRYRWRGCLAEAGSEIHDRRFPSPLEECHL